jgi:uncharacterized protein YcbX
VWVKEIWRYPVKSMAGELLQRAQVSRAGIAGDRVVQVVNAQGRMVTARRYPRLLGFAATLTDACQPSIDGRPWTDAEALGAVRRIVGPGARLVRDESVNRFDVLPLLVATDGAIAEFGRDRRRLRPNVVVGGVAGLEEREWPGGQLTIGHVVIRVQDLRSRCVMTTFDPDTLAQDSDVLREIVERFGGALALNCEVVVGGEIQVNQKVEFHGPSISAAMED